MGFSSMNKTHRGVNNGKLSTVACQDASSCYLLCRKREEDSADQ
jgi:hypothetical protein